MLEPWVVQEFACLNGSYNAMLNGMQTTIDQAGRVVLPKRIRDRLGLRPGDRIDIDENQGVVEIRLHPVVAQLVPAEDGRGLVLEVPDGHSSLSDEDVRRLVEEGREWPRQS